MRNKRRNFLYKILYYFNLIFSSLLIISYLAAFIKPSSFWPIGVLGLAYVYLLFINIAFILFWVVFKRKYIFLSLIAILIGWRHIGAHVNINSKSNEKADLIIISYNAQRLMRNKTYKNSLPMWEMLDKHKPDIVCFQEFFLKNEFIKLKDQFPSLKNHQFLTNKYYNGIFTLSRYPSINKGQIEFDTYFAVYDDLIINRDTIRIYNVQLNSNKFREEKVIFDDPIHFDEEKSEKVKSLLRKLKDAYKIRDKQVDMLSRHINNCPYPYFICGDLNDTPLSYTYHQLSENLSDAFITAGNGIGNTHNENLPPIRIDYILYPKECYTTKDYNTIDIEFSDHFPIISRLKKK